MTDKKQIIFEGRSYAVPVWVEWVALDEDNIANGFNKKPRRDIGGFWFVDFSDGGKSVRTLPKYFTNKKNEMAINWRDSLTKV